MLLCNFIHKLTQHNQDSQLYIARKWEGSSLDLFRLHKRKHLSVAWYTFPVRNKEACVGLLVGSCQPLLVWRATFFIP